MLICLRRRTGRFLRRIRCMCGCAQDSVKGIDDDEEKKKEKEQAQSDFSKTLSFLQDALGDKKISK